MSQVRIASIQYAYQGSVEATMQKAYDMCVQAAKAGAQVICLPEMYRSMYFCQGQDYEHFGLAEEALEGDSAKKFRALATAYQVVVVVPIFEKRADGLYHNSAVVVDADGEIAGIYRKMHIPQDPGFDEKFYFTPGDLGFKVFSTRYATIGVLICWDQWYPEAARITAMMGAEILLYPTAIGWDSKEPKEVQYGQLDSWKTIQRAHAISNGCYVCATNRIGTEGDLSFWGNSFMADPQGRLLFNMGSTQEGFEIGLMDRARLDWTRTRWPFFRDRRIDAYGSLTQRFLK